jgi:hypothetical protein
VTWEHQSQGKIRRRQKMRGAPNAGTKRAAAEPRTALSHAMGERQKVRSMLDLQRQYGNRFVQRFIAQDAIQTKLQVSEPGDTFEQEADRVAEAVMRIPAPNVAEAASASGALQTLQTKELPALQRPAGCGRGTEEVPPVVHDVLRSAGRPLDRSVQTEMEARFGGADFSAVRVHTDARATESASSVNALAYTVGQHVVFGQTSVTMPKPLLAHELTHVLQSSAGKDSSLGKTPLRRQHAGVPESCTSREPNSSAVKTIIEDAIGGSMGSNHSVNDLNNAWYQVRSKREKPDGSNCCSAELAAAEHYLYARYAVANRDHSPVEMKVMIWGYGYLKFLVPKTGICPKSPDTQGSRDWGYRGADDGRSDLFHQELA